MIGIKKIFENEKRLGDLEYESKNEIFNKSNIPNQDNLQISTNLLYEFINKPDILRSNAKLWNSFLDKRLHEFVIIHNFDFYEISNRFQNVVVQPLKYYFNEDEIRKHWSFLYACRKINFVPEDTYYKNLKTKYDFEIKPQNFGEIRVNSSSTFNEIFEELKESNEIDNSSNNVINCLNKMIMEENDEDVPELEMNVNRNKSKDNNHNDKSNCSATIIEPKENCKFNEKLNVKIKSEEKEEKANVSLDNSSKNNNILNKVQENENNYESKLFYTPEYRPLSGRNDKIDNNTNKKETKDNKSKSMVNYNDDSDEDEIFPINYEKAPMNNNNSLMDTHFQNNCDEYFDYDYSFQKTKNFDDFVRENEKLKKQYEDINKYFTFAMKGISHLIPKMMEDNSNTNTNKIEDTEIDIKIEDKEKQYFLDVGKKINDYVQEAVRYCLYIGKLQ